MPVAEGGRAPREGPDRREVDGVSPAARVTPHSVGELAALLAEGPTDAVVFKGAGTKLDWGAPPRRLDTLVDLSELPLDIEHSAGDLVVRVSASVPLAALNDELAHAGQRLAIDEVVTGSTVGGVIATGLSGPLRLGFGSVRDLLLGIAVVRADGARARAGGKVVKNVAGYDLAKLFTGSYGTLGAITEAHFRLHPIAQCRRYLTFRVATEAGAAVAVRRLATSTAAPAAIELWRAGATPFAITVLLEGSARSVVARAADLELLLAMSAEHDDEAPAHFGRLPGVSTLKLTFAPGAIAPLLAELAALPELSAVAEGGVAELAGSAAIGLLHLGLPAGVPLGALLEGCRRVTAAHGGSTSVLRAPAGGRPAASRCGGLPPRRRCSVP